jgi:hypothetical protein
MVKNRDLIIKHKFMSIRAHKIKKIISEEKSTFNLSDDVIMDLASNCYTNDNGQIYIIEFEKDVIKATLKEAFDDSKIGNPWNSNTLCALENILADFGKNDDFIMYECY